METFALRPGYNSQKLLIEFYGDHRSDSYPNVPSLLAKGLQAKQHKHPTLDTARICISTDELISWWCYENGAYELDDDIWGLFIHAADNNAKIMSDVEKILLASGEFEKQVVDFSEYR